MDFDPEVEVAGVPAPEGFLSCNFFVLFFQSKNSLYSWVSVDDNKCIICELSVVNVQVPQTPRPAAFPGSCARRSLVVYSTRVCWEFDVRVRI